MVKLHPYILILFDTVVSDSQEFTSSFNKGTSIGLFTLIFIFRFLYFTFFKLVNSMNFFVVMTINYIYICVKRYFPSE